MKFNPKDFWGIKRKEGEIRVGDVVLAIPKEGRTTETIGASFPYYKENLRRLYERGEIKEEIYQSYRECREMPTGLYKIVYVFPKEESVKDPRYIVKNIQTGNVHAVHNDYGELTLHRGGYD